MKNKKQYQHINLQTFEGVKELTDRLVNKDFAKDWGLDNKQIKELKQVYKKMRQAEKKTGSSRENAQKSAQREFYNALGLGAGGKFSEDLDKKMFGRSYGKEGAYAKIPVAKPAKPSLRSGHIQTFSDLAKNLDFVKFEMDYYNLESRMNTRWKSDYIEWFDAFMDAAGFGDIDNGVIGALDYMLNNRALMNKTAQWLDNTGLSIDLSGSFFENITDIIGAIPDEDYEIRNFLINVRSRIG